LLTAGAIAGVLAVVVAAGWALRGTLLTWMGRQLICGDPPARSDAIVVLSGGSPAREIEAADLYRAGYAPQVVITREPEDPGVEMLAKRGVRTPTAIMERLRYLDELGVPGSVVRTLGVVESTAGEASSVVDWARARQIKSLLIVTSAFHTCRAKLAFDRSLNNSRITVRFRPSSADRFISETWWRNRVTLRNGVIEWQKLLLYRLHLE
jgi:uncharacterized SAM-binding protein YcdF (DUF218 family)